MAILDSTRTGSLSIYHTCEVLIEASSDAKLCLACKNTEGPCPAWYVVPKRMIVQIHQAIQHMQIYVHLRRMNV